MSATGFRLNDTKKDVSAEDAGTTIHLRDIAGEPMMYGGEEIALEGGEREIVGAKPVTLTIAGSYSARFKKAEQAFTAKIGKEKRAGATVSEIMARRALELTAACVIAWDGITYDGTVPVPLSKENAEAVFTEARWIFDQAFEASNDHASFSTPSSSR